MGLADFECQSNSHLNSCSRMVVSVRQGEWTMMISDIYAYIYLATLLLYCDATTNIAYVLLLP